MKYLFLDVDGVLHPLPSLQELEEKGSKSATFTPSCMQELKRIIDETGAHIILSSSWRCFESTRNYLQENLSHKIHDYTSIADTGDGRAGQILRYVQEHPSDGWAVVDDEQLIHGDSLMMQVLAQNFVRTNSAVGLTREDADRTISLLNEGPPRS